MDAGVQWRVAAWFDTQEQAKLAADAIKALSPRAYQFSAWDGRDQRMWKEQGDEYGANDVRV